MANCKATVYLGKENICKNCIKTDVCKVVEEFKKEPVDGMYIEGCEYFKDRTQFVELPCKVGDTVYILEYEDGEAVDYGGWIFLMANNDFALLSPTVNDESHPIELCNFYFERYVECEEHPDFVVIVPLNEIYFTKKEAEKALEECENNANT